MISRPLAAVLVAGLVATACTQGEPAQLVPPRPMAVAVLTLERPEGDDPATELAAGVAVEVVNHLVRDPRILVRSPANPRVSPLEPKAMVAEQADADVVVWVGAGRRDGAAIVSWRADSLRGSWTGVGRVVGVSGDLRSVPAQIAAAILATLPGGDDDALGDSGVWPALDDSAAYVRYLHALGKKSAGTLDESARAALFDSISDVARSHPPAAVEVGAALLDLAGRVGGAGPHYDRAEDAIQHAFRLDSTYPPARRLRASYFAKRGRAEEAVTLLQNGLGAHPEYPDFHSQLGYVFRYGGLFRESIERYRRAQELDGSVDCKASTQDQITKSLIYLGQYADALASHELADTLRARLGRQPNDKAWFYRGVINLYAGDSAKALDSFRKGEGLDSASVWTQFGRGYAGIIRHDTAAVVAVLDSLERRVVVDGERHYRLVHLAAFLGDSERAIGHLTTAIQSGFFAVPYLEADPLTASLRQHEGFRKVIDEARVRHRAFAELSGRP